MIHLVTFSDESMSRSRELCVESAMSNGADSAGTYSPQGIGLSEVVKANPQVFIQPPPPRAWAWWAWKPLVIGYWMESADDNDICIYADAGVEFIDNVNYIIDRMDQDIFLFGNMYNHAHWCKRDVIETIIGEHEWLWESDGSCYWCGFETSKDRNGVVWCKSSNGGAEGCGHVRQPLAFGKQVQASVIFFRVNDKTKAFVKEWLDWCLFENGKLIDDSPSRTPNHPEFQENRHDQAILTTMAYRDGIKLHWWPAQYNDGAFIYERGDYPDEGYPVIVHHHRKRNVDWEAAA